MSYPVTANTPSVNGWNAAYLEEQYARFKADPNSVPDDLRAFLQGFDLAQSSSGAVAPAATRGGEDLAKSGAFHTAVLSLISAYRHTGHLAAALDPFGRARKRPGSIEIASHGLTSSDLDKTVHGHGLPISDGAKLREIIAFLEKKYCGSIGAQFMHTADAEQRRWWLDRFEKTEPGANLSREGRLAILDQITRAEQFEKFLQKRYPGDKRFSLEGGESLIALLEQVILVSSEMGVEELVMGMPHRGRLNVLNNIVGKTYEQIFTEFEDNYEQTFADGGGDVKYHRGYSGERKLPSGKTMQLVMASNPSHLESVNAVVMGRTRSKQRLRVDTERQRVVPLLIHGDAAVIAQGVVAECLNFSQLRGYTVGGALHVVVNNLIGFTTGQEDARSTPYCTDLALMLDAPVLHVAGNDPEAVVAAAKLAVEYRQTFKRDVFVEMWCFRKYGHNEQDEPSFTQPILAELIRKEPGVISRYADRLVANGVATSQELDAQRERLDAVLEKAQQAAKGTPCDPTIDPAGRRWSGMNNEYSHEAVKTALSPAALDEVCAALGRTPQGFNVNPKLTKLLADRAALASALKDDKVVLNYADAEQIAVGSLLLEGTAVRISGQDAKRGTFSTRHAVLRDARSGEEYVSLNAMREVAVRPDDAAKTKGADGRPTQAKYCIHDSPLSEYSVMGFDYGYSLSDPTMLVCWEGQFGDFGNCAQVIIDQYLASGEIKWARWSGLVLLLPHGYEGAGPEHSSARMERFLQLCADDNMQVVYPSTGAQVFHLLRRQVRRPFRKPLVVMTPKSMLRVPTSKVAELTTGRFEEVIDDPYFEANKAERRSVSRVILCSGKVYYDLAERRQALRRYDTAIIRIEQLYPFHEALMREVLGRYASKVSLHWVQEEPRNAGAFTYIDDVFRTLFKKSLEYTGRDASATPAVGSKHVHKDQQEQIIRSAIGPLPAGKGDPHAHGANGSAAAKPVSSVKS